MANELPDRFLFFSRLFTDDKKTEDKSADIDLIQRDISKHSACADQNAMLLNTTKYQHWCFGTTPHIHLFLALPLFLDFSGRHVALMFLGIQVYSSPSPVVNKSSEELKDYMYAEPYRVEVEAICAQ